MLPASHLISHGVPGHGPSDGMCLGLSMVSPCSSCKDYRKFPHIKAVPFRCASRGSSISFICNANSSGQRRNPDFSRQNRQGYSRNKNRHNEDQNGIDGFEDSEVFSSKNGPSSGSGPGPGPSFLSGSSPSPKFQSAATPGPREREIVEIFRKVQAQLRERAAQKEEKKVEDSQGHNKQNETVDSLLKLLRKHSVQHGKSNTSSRNNRDFVLDHQPEQNHSFTEDKTQKDSSKKVNEEVVSAEIQSVRPVSNFQRRSPVPRFKYKPIEAEPDTDIDIDTDTDLTPEVKMETGSEPEVFDGFDESSDDESSEIEDIHDSNVIENDDFSSMKMVELRAVAKSRGIKGYSKLKKSDLLELLSS